MSFLSRKRRYRLRKFEELKRQNSAQIRTLTDWQLIDIHQTDFKEGQEFDFWVSNKKDFYLLRVRKSEIENYTIVKSKGKDAILYLVAELNFEILKDKTLGEILSKFSLLGIPHYHYQAILHKLK
jgi:hypothetical protein